MDQSLKAYISGFHCLLGDECIHIFKFLRNDIKRAGPPWGSFHGNYTSFDSSRFEYPSSRYVFICDLLGIE